MYKLYILDFVVTTVNLHLFHCCFLWCYRFNNPSIFKVKVNFHTAQVSYWSKGLEFCTYAVHSWVNLRSYKFGAIFSQLSCLMTSLHYYVPVRHSQELKGKVRGLNDFLRKSQCQTCNEGMKTICRLQNLFCIRLPNSQTIQQRWRGTLESQPRIKASSETSGLTARQKNSEVVMKRESRHHIK